MCLVINFKKHSSNIKTGKYRPRISIFPIVVYKVLYKKEYGISWYTPQRDFPIEFHNNKCVMESDMVSSYASDSYVDLVFQGIHAFTESGIAIHASRFWETNGFIKNYHVFKAIIPPFTKYFIGINDDIVSEKLIIKNKIIK